jgi:tetratricopeptide (TPR) repeat protein
LQYLREGKFRQALEDFHAASEYPENLSVGRPRNDGRAPQVAYHTGKAYEALGDAERAAEFYKKAAAHSGAAGASEARFYQGLSLGKLGRDSEADKIFDGLIKSGQKRLSERGAVDVFAKFGEGQTAAAREASTHYALGLGYLGRGRHDKAQAAFEKAVELNVSHVWARARLAELGTR